MPHKFIHPKKRSIKNKCEKLRIVSKNLRGKAKGMSNEAKQRWVNNAVHNGADIIMIQETKAGSKEEAMTFFPKKWHTHTSTLLINHLHQQAFSLL